MRFSTAFFTALFGLLAAAPALAQPTTQVLSGVLSQNLTLDASEVYLLDGEVYVEDGVTLTIPAGTIIKGKQEPSPSTNSQASVLVVQQGGRLVADGRADSPIIFTAEVDDVFDPFDTDETQWGLWGGVVILGRATNNRGIRNIEGITASPRTQYGCDDATIMCDDDESSGTIRYVSIRHAGFTRTPNEEINGLTFGGVGRGTLVEYVEVFANSDDSFEWFGGTVNTKYLVGAFGGDDDFDWDTGFSGKGQFWFSIKASSGDVGRCIEGDGAASPFTATPLSRPVVSNMTCIGSGLGSAPGGSDAGGPSLKLRENTQGFIYNSVFYDVQSTAGGIDLEETGDPATSTVQNFLDGELDIRNNIFFAFSVGNTAADIVTGDNAAVISAIDARNAFAEPGLGPISRTQEFALDPRPLPTALAASGAVFSYDPLNVNGGDDFFTPVDYHGAFAPGVPVWAAGWTAIDQMGYLSALSTPNEDGAAATGFGLAAAYPNPVATAATVTFELDRAQAVTLAVYDVLGREVAVLARGEQPVGRTSVTLDAASLPAGVYLVRLAGESAAAAQKIVVVR